MSTTDTLDRPAEVDETKQILTAEVKAIDATARTVTAMVSTESVDRHGEVLIAAGCDLTDYEKNPIVLWQHDRGEWSMIPTVVGKAENVRIVPGQGIEATIRFHDATQLAREVGALYLGGFLSAFSVGFRSKVRVMEPVKPAEGQTGDTVTEWALLEISCVTLPANPDAVVGRSLKTLAAGGNALALDFLRADPDAQAEYREARVAHDLRRWLGAAESVRNGVKALIRDAAFDGDLPVTADALARADTLLDEVKSLVTPPATEPEPHPAEAEGTTTDDASPEPDPADGALSDDAAQKAAGLDLMAELRGLKELLATSQANQRAAIRDAIDAERRSYIGR